MATLVPPPSKRQRTAVAQRAREQQDVDVVPSNLGNIRISFIDHSTDQPFGAPVLVPLADANVRNLSLLLNTLQEKVNLWPQFILERPLSFSRVLMSEYHIALLMSIKVQIVTFSFLLIVILDVYRHLFPSSLDLLQHNLFLTSLIKTIR